MKKILSLLLVAVMTLSLAACGGKSESTTNESGAAASSGSGDKIVIWQPSDKESVENWWVEKLAEWNEANPDIQVERIAIDRSDSYAYENKIATAVTSGDLPDILFVDGPQVSYYAANGIIIPLDAYFEDTSDFVNSTVAQCTYDGKLYAMSATESSVAFYYNKNYLEECGVDVAKLDSYTVDNPMTWSEMEEIAKACTTDSYVGTHIVMDHGEGIPYALEPMYKSNGVDYLSDDGSVANGYVNSPEAVETTEFLAGLIAKGYANVDPITDEFINGACATEIMGSWEVSTLQNANVDFDWGVTYYPVSDKTKTPVSPCGDWSAAISASCANPDGAGAFLSWLMSTENVASYAACIAKPASRQSAYDDAAMADYKNYPLTVFVEELASNASPRPRTPAYSTFSTDYAEAMTNIFSAAASDGTVDKAMIQEQLDNVANSFEEDYNNNYK